MRLLKRVYPMNSEARCITQDALLGGMLEETALFIENNLEETEPVLDCLKKRKFLLEDRKGTQT